MNLTKLFETQKALDAKIVREKGLEGQNLLAKKFLALRTELGEFANELPEEFKFWANKINNYERALKEFVDGLHFVISIGLNIGANVEKIESAAEEFGFVSKEGAYQINDVYLNISDLEINIRLNNKQGIESEYEDLILRFLLLGLRFGFEWEQIEQAYYEKNRINHERQATGY